MIVHYRELATMLNILLSALIDPDRRLRSFRRSERLASILVCIILGPLLCLFLYTFGMCFRASGAYFSSCHVRQNNKLDFVEY